MITSPSSINLLKNSSSIILTYGFKTNFTQELVGGRSGYAVIYVLDYDVATEIAQVSD